MGRAARDFHRKIVQVALCPVSVDAKGARSEQRTMAVRTPTATASLTPSGPGSLSKKEPLRHSPWP